MSKYDDMAFVPVVEIYNLFTMALRELDDEILPSLPESHRTEIVEFVDGLRLRLISRARENLKGYLQKSPIIKQEQRDEKAIATEEKNRQTWQERVARARSFQT